ncbi:hypothetical protein IMSAGC013_01179 [Lachnospiraceae bacterium]|nr:hypothetical protein IMSAGC013_01179 [Lachnospiraceae bacterium]
MSIKTASKSTNKKYQSRKGELTGTNDREN